MRLWFCSVSIPRGPEKAHDRKGLRRARPGKPDVLLLRLWLSSGGEDGIEPWVNRNRRTVSRHSDFAPAAKQALATVKRELGSFPTARRTSLNARGLFFKNPNSLCSFKALTPLKISIVLCPCPELAVPEGVIFISKRKKTCESPHKSFLSVPLPPNDASMGANSALLFSKFVLKFILPQAGTM